MPDDPKLPPLWTMLSKADLYYYMWSQGLLDPYGYPKDKAFDPNNAEHVEQAERAFQDYWETEFKELHNEAFPAEERYGDNTVEEMDEALAGSTQWQLSSTRTDLKDIATSGDVISMSEADPVTAFIDIRFPTLDEYLEGKGIQELIQLYSDVSPVFSSYFPGIEDQNALDIAQYWMFLNALETGKPLPFLPEFDLYLLRNYAAQVYGSVVGYGSVEDYEEFRKDFPLQLAPLLAVVLGNIDETSELNFLADIAYNQGAVPGTFKYNFMSMLSQEEYDVMIKTIQAALPANYTAEEAAALNYWIASQALQELPEDSELRPELLKHLFASGLFLEASELDKRRQAVYRLTAALGHLNEAINTMPNEIIGIPVDHIKQAFQAFYQGMVIYLAGTESDLLNPEQILATEQSFEELAEQMPDSPGLSWFLELALSILVEPADWYFSARDLASGDLWALTTFIPFLPGFGRISGFFDDILSFSDEMFKGGRWLDCLVAPDFTTFSYKATSSSALGGGLGGITFDINPHEEAVLRDLGFSFSQEEIDRLIELSTDLPQGVPDLHSIRPQEGASAYWAAQEMSARLGRVVELERSTHPNADWIDKLNKDTYDAIRGYHGPYGNYTYNESAFIVALNEHEKIGLKYIIIDVTGLSSADIQLAKIAAARTMATWTITPKPQLLWQEP